MTPTMKRFLTALAAVSAVLISAWLWSTGSATGFECAFLGGLISGVKSVVGAVGSVVGIGGGSNKPIQVTTGSDPNVTKTIDLLASQTKLLTEQLTSQKQATGGFFSQKVLGMPVGALFAIGGAGVAAYFMFRK